MNDLALLLSVVSVNTCLKRCVKFDLFHVKYLELPVRKGVIFNSFKSLNFFKHLKSVKIQHVLLLGTV